MTFILVLGGNLIIFLIVALLPTCPKPSALFFTHYLVGLLAFLVSGYIDSIDRDR